MIEWAWPDIAVDYMANDNLFNRGRSFVSAFPAALVKLIQSGRQALEHAYENNSAAEAVSSRPGLILFLRYRSPRFWVGLGALTLGRLSQEFSS